MEPIDKKFEQMMQGIKLDSPSGNFTEKVMQCIQNEAEVAKLKRNVYEPVISKKTWVILSVGFVVLAVFALLSDESHSADTPTGLLRDLYPSLKISNFSTISNLWDPITRLFTTVPLMVYITFISSLVLWSFDRLLSQFQYNR
jgi:hypothetical protein